MDLVQCNGTETSLKNCIFAGFGVAPLRYRIDLFAAGVVCYSKWECVCAHKCPSNRSTTYVYINKIQTFNYEEQA